MSLAITKVDYPVSQVRRYLEPGPVVLVSSKWNGKTNIMTLGWHTVLEFSPSLVGLMTRDGQCVVGTELNATHHRAVSQGKVRGVCQPLHLGRQSQSWEIVIFDEQGRRCCTCRLGTAVMG